MRTFDWARPVVLGLLMACGGSDEPGDVTGDTAAPTTTDSTRTEADEFLVFEAVAGVASEHVFDIPTGGEDTSCNLGEGVPAGVWVDEDTDGEATMHVEVADAGLYTFSMTCVVITDTPDSRRRLYDVELTVTD